MAHSVSRSTLLAGFLAVALLALGTPAFAKKKKAPAAEGETPSSEAAGDDGKDGGGGGGKKANPAAQAGDTERPTPILDTSDAPEGPKADAEGNVNFAGSKVGKGKITVRSSGKEKVKVYLEGRYFGVAPRTITKIPPGDYIVEVVFPNGKSVSKPVSVSGDEEALVQLGAADAAPVVAAEKAMAPEQVEKRWSLAKTVGYSAAGVLVVGLGLGVWEYTVQKDYNKKADMGAPADAAGATKFLNDLKALSDKGDHLALAANTCYVLGALGLVAAVVIGYPAYKARHTERKPASPETNVSFIFAPSPTLNSATAGMILQF